MELYYMIGVTERKKSQTLLDICKELDFKGALLIGHIGKLVAKKCAGIGMKVIIIDPKITPAVERLCDLYLRPYPGTDGALALCMGNILIEQGWIDSSDVRKHFREKNA